MEGRGLKPVKSYTASYKSTAVEVSILTTIDLDREKKNPTASQRYFKLNTTVIEALTSKTNY